MQTQTNMHVVPEDCEWAADRSAATIVVESSNEDFPRAIEELASVDARNLALAYAAENGVASPSIGGIVGHAFPVNYDGKPLQEVQEANKSNPLPANHPDMQPARYRTEIRVNRNNR